MDIKENSEITDLQDKVRLLLSHGDEGVLAVIEEHQRLSEESGNRDHLGESHINYALYYSIIELNYEKFREYSESAIQYFDLTNNRRAAYYYGNIAFCCQAHSKMPESQVYFLRAIYCMEQIPDRTENETKRLASHYYNLYTLFGFSDLGTLDKRYINRALELNISVDNKRGISYNYNAIVAENDRLGKIPEALDYALKRIQIVEELHDLPQLGLAYCSAGLMYAKLSDKEKSFEYFAKARKVLFPDSNPQLMAGYHQEIAEAYSVFGNYEEAIANYNEAIRLYEHFGSTLNLSKIYRLLSKAHKDAGDLANALLYQEKHSQSLLDNFKLDKLLAVTATEHEFEQKLQEAETALLKQKNEEIGVYVKQLEQSNDDLKQFAHAASHDLREPVRTIVSYANLLEISLKDQLNEDQKVYIAYLKEGGKRINDMVTGILAFSKVNSEQEVYGIDLNEIYDQVMDNLKLAVAARDAVIECPRLPLVQGSSTLLIQLFQNLISNAIKYNQAEVPVVRISFRRVDNTYEFKISDNGIGIESKYKENVFEIFTRLHNRDHYQGTGIGLSICRKIIERMGGRIWNEPNDMGGTDFVFTLPVGS